VSGVAPPSESLPSVADVIARFRRALAGDAERPPDEMTSLLLELHSNNIAQWAREDSARRHDADDSAVAAAKRDIDALNSVRHRLVEALDAAFDAAISQVPSAPPSTETPAMAYDRLSVLVIRVHFTERAAGTGRPDRDGYEGRLPALYRQLAVAQEALEGLLDDLRVGRKRFVPYESFKLYGPPPNAE